MEFLVKSAWIDLAHQQTKNLSSSTKETITLANIMASAHPTYCTFPHVGWFEGMNKQWFLTLLGIRMIAEFCAEVVCEIVLLESASCSKVSIKSAYVRQSWFEYGGWTRTLNTVPPELSQQRQSDFLTCHTGRTINWSPPFSFDPCQRKHSWFHCGGILRFQTRLRTSTSHLSRRSLRKRTSRYTFASLMRKYSATSWTVRTVNSSVIFWMDFAINSLHPGFE